MNDDEPPKGSSRIPRIVRRVLASSGFLFYYGEPGAGKTILANLLAQTIHIMRGVKACIIATEPGSILLPGVEAKRVYAVNIENMIELILTCLSKRSPVIVDTINGYFTGAHEESRLLGLASALLRASSLPTVAVGQIRGQGEPWGGKWILPWATHVAVVRRLIKGVSVAEFLKPHRAFVAFRVEGGVQAGWT